MLKHLHIKNLVLIEDASLAFRPGLNILTGETGSGKSALMHGLSLAIGERSDSSLIRCGCEKGIVEAIFESDRLPLNSLLSDAGIDHENGDELIIRREISLSGKGRIFINNQPAQLSLLKKLGVLLVQMVGQHANQSLYSLDYHREVLDLYGNLGPLLRAFQKSHDHESQVRHALTQLIQQEAQRMREIAVCEKELEEIDTARLKEGEEEELFAEYTRLSNAEEISTKIFDINQTLSGERNPILTVLNRQKQTLESLLRFDPSLQEPHDALKNALLELQEIAHSLQRYQNSLYFDPNRLKTSNDRLTLIAHLKRKYGSSIEAIMAYRLQTSDKLKKLENADLEIEGLRQKLAESERETQRLAHELSVKRRKVASSFEKETTAHLHSLNMSKAVFSIQLHQQQRTREGDESVEFFLRPNIGEHQIALREGASGGEMSRILLALQTLLAGKEQRATLIFDEVDANIGGETATIVGNKLVQISEQHQVICITHFPQVASQAAHHFQISKEEKEGRTVTTIQELDQSTRQFELSRMAGHALPASICV